MGTIKGLSDLIHHNSGNSEANFEVRSEGRQGESAASIDASVGRLEITPEP